MKTRLAESLGVIFQDKQAIKMLEKKVSMGNLALRNENIKNTEFSELLGSCADKTQLLLKDVGSTISAVQKLPDLLERMSFKEAKLRGSPKKNRVRRLFFAHLILRLLIPLAPVVAVVTTVAVVAASTIHCFCCYYYYYYCDCCYFFFCGCSCHSCCGRCYLIKLTILLLLLLLFRLWLLL